jgi:hypothetical protein
MYQFGFVMSNVWYRVHGLKHWKIIEYVKNCDDEGF